MIDLQELTTTARLAHLNVSKDELAAALPAFEQMIGFFSAMEEADNDTAFSQQDDVSPLTSTHFVGAEHFRKDESEAGVAVYPPYLNEKMLNNAGKRDGSFIVIPNVL